MADFAYGVANWVTVGGDYTRKAIRSGRRKLANGSRQRADERARESARESIAPYYPPDPALPKYTWRPLLTRHAFRLVELHAGTLSDPLHCSLVEEDLDQFVDFCALSYCVGDPSASNVILCENQSLAVTQSLYDALIRLRKADASIRIWIDALSIDQSNTPERMKQIRLMGRIYRQAKPCIIWLGPHTDEDALALKLLETLQRFLKAGDTDERATELLPETLSTKYATTSEQWKALANLFLRPLFTRVWCFQEAVVPKKTLVMCGKFSIDGQVFFNIVDFLHSLPYAPEQLNAQEGFLRCVKISSLRKQFFDPLRAHPYGELDNLLDTLRTARDRDATDAHDKILGVVHMSNCTQDDVAWYIDIEYSMPVEETYYGFARHILASGSPLRLLNACHPPSPCTPSKLSTQLPSWVPDWTRRIATPPCIRSFEKSTRYKAHGRTQPTFQILPGDRGNILSIQGKVICSVATLIDKHSSPLNEAFQKEYLPTKSKREKLAEWYFHIAIGWVFETSKDKRCPEKTIDQYFLAACWSATPRTCTRRTFLETLQSALLSPTTKELASKFTAEQLLTYANGYHQHDSTDTVQSTFLSNIEAWTLVRQFCVTSTGHIGWVPLDARKGDVVVVFAGGKLPYVLRPCGGGDQFTETPGDVKRYTIVGHCFVHGLMFGEAMADESISLQNINLK